MMNRHSGTKLNIPMCIACVLFCVTLFSMHLTGGLYARYSEAGSGEDGARVAAFRVETDLALEAGAGETPSLQLGGTDSISSIQIPFYIDNYSEVAVAYSVTVDFGIELPSYLTLTLSDTSDDSREQSIRADGDKKIFEFIEFGTIEAGAGTVQRENLTLTFTISDLSLITEEVKIPTAELIIKVYQID